MTDQFRFRSIDHADGALEALSTQRRRNIGIVPEREKEIRNINFVKQRFVTNID